MIHVLVGTTEHPGSERAAAWAAELTRLLGGDLEIAEAYQRHSAEQSPDDAAAAVADADVELQTWASHNGMSQWPRRTLPLDSDEAIQVAARDWNADMVVIGSHEVEGVTPLGLGSLAHRLAHHLPCPLVVVPPGQPSIDGGAVIVGVDGSHASERALHWASRLAAAIHGHVVAVFIVDAMYDTFDAAGFYGNEEKRARAEVRRGGPGIEFVERFGTDPAASLQKVANERDAALIVVAAKDHHSLGGKLLGVVADHLLHHPTRPVALLPHGFVEPMPAATEAVVS